MGQYIHTPWVVEVTQGHTGNTHGWCAWQVSILKEGVSVRVATQPSQNFQAKRSGEAERWVTKNSITMVTVALGPDSANRLTFKPLGGITWFDRKHKGWTFVSWFCGWGSIYVSRQFVMTLGEVTLNCGLVKESDPQNGRNIQIKDLEWIAQMYGRAGRLILCWAIFGKRHEGLNLCLKGSYVPGSINSLCWGRSSHLQ